MKNELEELKIKDIQTQSEKKELEQELARLKHDPTLEKEKPLKRPSAQTDAKDSPDIAKMKSQQEKIDNLEFEIKSLKNTLKGNYDSNGNLAPQGALKFTNGEEIVKQISLSQNPFAIYSDLK